MIKFKIGKDVVTGNMVLVADAERGRACNCICPECDKDLVAAKGKKNEFHFRHAAETDCLGGQETALHLLAKEIIAKNNTIVLPTIGTVNYQNTQIEKAIQNFRPDVLAEINGETLCFEVMVTHAVGSQKEKFYVENKLKVVEIDLSGVEYSSYEELENEVLRNEKNKNLIYWQPKTKTEKKDYTELIFGVAALVGIIFIIWYQLRPKKRTLTYA